MKNLIIDILKKLAKADAATKELTAQVEAQSLLLAALMLTVGKGSSSVMATNIQKAILSAASASEEILQTDVDLLMTHFVRLITVSQFIEANGDEANMDDLANAHDQLIADKEVSADDDANSKDPSTAKGQSNPNDQPSANDETNTKNEAHTPKDDQ
jgi:hypothetical protein